MKAPDAEQLANLIDTVAHDLKNPLAIIKGRVQLLQRRVERLPEDDAARLRDGLANVEGAANRMFHLIEGVLDVTRLQAGRPLALNLRPVDLLALVREVVAEHQQNTPRHQIRLLTTEEKLVGRWDAPRIQRVLENVVKNALTYSPGGGEVLVTAAREMADGRPWAVLSVRDRGIGIPAADLERIFAPFQRGGNVGRIPGIGVGLAGARRIVQLQGGDIHVDMQEGAGSTFTIRLPLHQEPLHQE